MQRYDFLANVIFAIFVVVFKRCFVKKLALIVLGGVFATAGFAQNEPEWNQWRMKFSLKIENNYSRTDFDKEFFGEKIFMVEFYTTNPWDMGHGYGFQIVKVPLRSSYVIGVKDFLSSKEIVAKEKELERKGLTKGEIDKRLEEEGFTFSSVRTRSFPISDILAKRIYKKFNSSIDTFDPGGPQPVLKNGQKNQMEICDGETVTFRCTTDNDIVKTLIVYVPVRKIGKLSDTCEQLIKDLQTGQMDESKYLNLFE